MLTRQKSEKQLKHILKKWSTKKKISSTDMQTMLAVKRKRSEDGKSTEFKYHGHVVDEVKLWRAEKRYKNSTSSNAGEYDFSCVCPSTLTTNY